MKNKHKVKIDWKIIILMFITGMFLMISVWALTPSIGETIKIILWANLGILALWGWLNIFREMDTNDI